AGCRGAFSPCCQTRPRGAVRGVVLEEDSEFLAVHAPGGYLRRPGCRIHSTRVQLLPDAEFAQRLEISFHGSQGFAVSLSVHVTRATSESRSVSYLRDLLLGILPFLLAIQCFAWLTFLPSALRGHADFRQLYSAGYMVRTGHSGELYDYQAQKAVQDAVVDDDELALPFIRPAYQALLFAPFS